MPRTRSRRKRSSSRDSYEMSRHYKRRRSPDDHYDNYCSSRFSRSRSPERKRYKDRSEHSYRDRSYSPDSSQHSHRSNGSSYYTSDTRSRHHSSSRSRRKRHRHRRSYRHRRRSYSSGSSRVSSSPACI